MFCIIVTRSMQLATDNKFIKRNLDGQATLRSLLGIVGEGYGFRTSMGELEIIYSQNILNSGLEAVAKFTGIEVPTKETVAIESEEDEFTLLICPSMMSESELLDFIGDSIIFLSPTSLDLNMVFSDMQSLCGVLKVDRNLLREY